MIDSYSVYTSLYLSLKLVWHMGAESSFSVTERITSTSTASSKRVGWDTKKDDNKMLDLVYGQWDLNSRFVVIDKPSAIPIQDPDNRKDTVESRIKRLLLQNMNMNKNNNNNVSAGAGAGAAAGQDIKLYFPHRIDKFTRGLLVVAFDQVTASQLGRAIQNKEWIKKYRVMCEIPPCLVMDELGDSYVSQSREKYQYRYGERSYRVICGSASNELKGTGLLRKCTKCNALWKCQCIKPTTQSSSSSSSSSSVLLEQGQDIINRLKSRLLSNGILESNIYCRNDSSFKTNNNNQTKQQSNNNNKNNKNNKNNNNNNNNSPRLLPPSCQYCVDSCEFKTKEHPFISKHFLYHSSRYNPTDQSTLAQTKFELVDVFKRKQQQHQSQQQQDDKYYALYDIQLLTGKTHQVRVHFSDAGFPIYDDPYYNQFTIKDLNNRLINHKNKNKKSSQPNNIQQQQPTNDIIGEDDNIEELFQQKQQPNNNNNVIKQSKTINSKNNKNNNNNNVNTSNNGDIVDKDRQHNVYLLIFNQITSSSSSSTDNYNSSTIQSGHFSILVDFFGETIDDSSPIGLQMLNQSILLGKARYPSFQGKIEKISQLFIWTHTRYSFDFENIYCRGTTTWGPKSNCQSYALYLLKDLNLCNYWPDHISIINDPSPWTIDLSPFFRDSLYPSIH
ncbi:hypothetical protein DFA_09713 [Cavenderia fasciculata]|uniref:Pseudouridine synthase RsuA/RluA-like domain-containing protein n=1 Tax=Cavenderia fasciculata TaxID=261658 RepID=F4Q8E1_CACFS|nr:uncharacterized protein DFA_09713 [Cavenderia fasciculata]EGG16041.1 hypothetical protein DFA_09713 [Cavenderia fasciculata]|eukprot:XP_004352366.1 hypothetical protein DFA_09713 [Cavenderia fasciculata]